MGRRGSVTLQHVRTAVAALQAEGKSVSSRAVREKLGNVGSMGTVNTLLQQCLAEKDETPESLRQLPPELQHAILTFADQQANDARSQIAEALVHCKQEMANLAEDNEQLTAIIHDVRGQLACATTDRAAIEGRVAQLLDELAGAREERAVERHDAEAARMEMVKLQLRVDALAPVEGELREARTQCEAQRSACARAEQAAAVLEAQKLALDNEGQNLKAELANVRVASHGLNTKIEKLSELLDRERGAREGAERDLAVVSATCFVRSATDKSSRKSGGQQATLWQGDVPDD